MADSNLKIVVSAEDNATPALNKIKQAFDQYQKSYESIGQFTTRQKTQNDALAASNQKLAGSAEAVAGSSRSLFTTFTTATLAANAIGAAVRFATTQFSASINAANSYQSAIAGLSSYAALFGNTTQQATAAVTNLSSDGLLPTVNAANALKNLLSSGLNLEQASGLVKVFEDRAAFGRNSTIGFGQAVENLSQAFRTEQSEAGDANGITENFSQILEVGAAALGKNVNQLSSLERAQAKLIGITQLSNATQGDAARYAETAAGQQAKLEYQITQTQIAFGTALQPAIQLINQSLVDLGQSFDMAGDGMKTAQMFTSTLAFAVVNAANVIVGAVQVMVGAFQAVQKQSLQPLNDAIRGSLDRIATSAVAYEQKMQDIAKGTADERIDQSKRVVDQVSADAARAASNVQRQIDQENRSFADSMTQRAAQFRQSMTDMIIAHRDKARSLQRDINDENAAYAEQVADRKDQLNDKMLSLEESHQEKVADITQQISDEKNKGLIVDGVLFSQANDKKIAELEQELAKEDAAYERQVAKVQVQYDKDVAADAKRHQDKLTNLQTSLNEETTILQAHAAEVAAVGEKQKEDDISRLQRQFAEENIRAAAQHQQRLVDIRQQGSAQGSTYGNALVNAQNQALQARIPEIQQVASNQGRKMSDSMWDGFMQRAQEFFKSLPRWIDEKTGAITGLKQLGEGVLRSIPVIGPIYDIGKRLKLFADGGVINRPTLMTDMASGRPYGVMGEAGPEAIVPMNRMVSGGSGGPSIHIGTVNNYTTADWTSWTKEVGFQLSLRL